jgi:hypothetical protein
MWGISGEGASRLGVEYVTYLDGSIGSYSRIAKSNCTPTLQVVSLSLEFSSIELNRLSFLPLTPTDRYSLRNSDSLIKGTITLSICIQL